MLLLILLLQLFSPQAQAAAASTCKDSLKQILTAAENKVYKVYKQGDACRIGALNGKKASKDCSGDLKLFKLKTTLAPYYYNAKRVCKNTCAKEGKGPACAKLITTDYMLASGINGLQESVSKISYSLEEEDLNFENFSTYTEWLEAASHADQEPKEVVTMDI